MAMNADENFVTRPPKTSERKRVEVKQNKRSKELNQNENPLEIMSIWTTKIKTGSGVQRKTCDTQNDPEVNEPRAMRKAAMNETNGHRRNTIWDHTKDSEPRLEFRHIPTEINGRNWDGKSSEKWNRNEMMGRS